MKIVNQFIIDRDDILSTFSIRRVCRFIKKNLDQDTAIAELAHKLNLNSGSDKQEIKQAIEELNRYIPYYTNITVDPFTIDTVKGTPFTIAHPVRLIKVASNNLYKVILETDMVSFIHTILNNTENYGVNLNLNNYVTIDNKGKVIRHYPKMNKQSKLYTGTFDDIALKSKNFQLKFLSLLHLNNFPVYTIVEYSTFRNENSLAYLFTISAKNGLRIVSLESLIPGTATLAFIITEKQFNKSINTIRKYFASQIPNKRAYLLNADNIFSFENGFVKRMKIVHNNQNNWETCLLKIASENL